MARRSRRVVQKPATSRSTETPGSTPAPGTSTPAFWSPLRVGIAAALLLGVHLALAVNSLVQENGTVDEVVHLPAGVSYWQQGTFKLYHHNPPLIKLAAALPVVLSRPQTAQLYKMPFWTQKLPDQATFAYAFSIENASRFFELCTRARLVMPLFSVIGGLVVFLWSRRLYGPLAGLLSLALWVFCPNVLAHARLVTTDVGATALGVAATYLFWRYLHDPSWWRAVLAGLMLGVAELSKFSLILLYGLWPALWLVSELARWDRADFGRRLMWSLGQGVLIVVLSVLVIDVGYGFEGVGTPLGSRSFEFACRTLTRPIPLGTPRPSSPNPLFDLAWRHRVNRFRGTLLDRFPSPLPAHYLLGFDEQKLEAEAIPREWLKGTRAESGEEESVGYPVYLDGQLRRTGWWYYYLFCLLYKVPEGTWLIVLWTIAVTILSRRARRGLLDEVTLWSVPVVVLFTMSFLTDINLGLRYVLPIAPYVFIAAGRLVPWIGGLLSAAQRKAAALVLGVSLAATVVSAVAIHPHYLAYFNFVSGGPAHGSEHLIDSNLDWGQDLVNLKAWVDANAPGEPVGLAYFGQVTPNLFALRGEPFAWFLPPALPGRLVARTSSPYLVGPAPSLKPGLYAVSATLLRGLPWRLYDPSLRAPLHAWSAGNDAFAYFRDVPPVGDVGHSIFLYRLTEDDVARLSHHWPREAK